MAAKTSYRSLTGISDAIYGGMRRGGYSQRDTADLLSIAPQTLSKWLANPSLIPVGALLTACRELDIPIEKIRECIK